MALVKEAILQLRIGGIAEAASSGNALSNSLERNEKILERIRGSTAGEGIKAVLDRASAGIAGGGAMVGGAGATAAATREMNVETARVAANWTRAAAETERYQAFVRAAKVETQETAKASQQIRFGQPGFAPPPGAAAGGHGMGGGHGMSSLFGKQGLQHLHHMMMIAGAGAAGSGILGLAGGALLGAQMGASFGIPGLLAGGLLGAAIFRPHEDKSAEMKNEFNIHVPLQDASIRRTLDEVNDRVASALNRRLADLADAARERQDAILGGLGR